MTGASRASLARQERHTTTTRSTTTTMSPSHRIIYAHACSLFSREEYMLLPIGGSLSSPSIPTAASVCSPPRSPINSRLRPSRLPISSFYLAPRLANLWCGSKVPQLSLKALSTTPRLEPARYAARRSPSSSIITTRHLLFSWASGSS